ncbi:hypothetical protein BT67DRAFT_139183 [Trichocladium antarcticum]|uniref:Uncharacterized protein n=1 Tax=Trichocladium antarcticum TaxID=1450529 RepID=A0AAN6UF77_9PEZI|nr:hypothetical protein BT67DRAFT_139183 [Trichocladium antarcticum]
MEARLAASAKSIRVCVRACLQILYPGSTSTQAKDGFLCTTDRCSLARRPNTAAAVTYAHGSCAPHFQQALQSVARRDDGKNAAVQRRSTTLRAVARCVVHATTRDIGSCPNTAGHHKSCRIRGQPPQQSTRNSLRCSHRPRAPLRSEIKIPEDRPAGHNHRRPIYPSIHRLIRPPWWPLAKVYFRFFFVGGKKMRPDGWAWLEERGP